MSKSEIIQLLTLFVVIWYTYVTYRLLSAQTKQGFENKFFQLLQLHHEIVNAMQKTYGSQVITGRQVFEKLYGEFVRDCTNEFRKASSDPPVKIIERSYLAFFNRNEPELGHYFRNLYNIFKFIDSSKQDQKTFYSNLTRAQLSIPELLLLFYDALTPLGVDKFKPLIEKYTILKNIPPSKLVSGIQKFPTGHETLYNSSAFTKQT